MNFKIFLKNNLIKKIDPDFNQITHQLKRAEQDLITAKANLKIDTTWALTIAYHAMMRAGRALIFAHGYLPTANQSHKTIVELTKLLTDKTHQEIIEKFNRLRRRRHHFIYESENHVNIEEAESALHTAEQLIKQIKVQTNVLFQKRKK